jgi:hypothetical protein
MKIIVTKEQKKVINEALGVPKHILDVAEKMYQIVLRDLKSITEKQNEYEFDGVTYFDLGDKKQIPIRSYTLTVEVDKTDQVEDGVVLGSMGMGQQFRFDRGIMMRLNAESNEADFHINFYAAEDWEPKDLVDWFENNRDVAESSLAHELKHKYDQQVNRKGLIGNEAQYIAYQNLPSVMIPQVDDQFYRYLYFTDAMESSVRATEVASNIRTQGIKKSEFRDFLKNNRTFKIMMEIKNFTFEKLIRGVYENLDTVDRIFEAIGVDTENMSDKDKVKKMLELIYVNIANKKIEIFDEYVDRGQDSFLSFIRQLGGIVDEDDIKVEQIKKNFRNFVAKYENNPLGFFKAEIDKFHRVSDQVIRKIGKLYDMAQDDTQVTESIIDWELHMKLQQKKHGNRPLDTQIKFVTEDKQSKIEDIRQMVKDPEQFTSISKMMGIGNLIKIVYDGDLIKFSEDTTTPIAYLSTDGMNLYLHEALVNSLGLEDMTWLSRSEKKLGKFVYGSKNGHRYAFTASLTPTTLNNQPYYKVVGTSGDSGFGYGFINQKNVLGKRYRGQIFKQIIDKYGLEPYMKIKTFY